MTGSGSRFYDDLDTFFRERGLRQGGDGSWLEDSYDYGTWWMGRQRDVYRVTWLGPTHRPPESVCGELYLVRLSGPHVASSAEVSVVSAGLDSGAVEFLCVIPPETVEGSHMTDGRADTLLDGWADDGVCGAPGSIEWVRDRAAEARLLWPDLQS